MISTLLQTTISSLLTFVYSSTTDTNSSSTLVSVSNTTTLQPEGGDGDYHDPFNNPWTLISTSTRKKVVRLITFLSTLLLAVGVPANVINCLVFYRQGLRDRMNLCLWWLSVADLCYLAGPTINTAGNLIELVDPEFFKEFNTYSTVYLSGMTASFLNVSAFTTMVIAVERCLCVLFPLKAHNLMSTRTMAVLLLTITLMLQLGSVLFPLHWRVERSANNQTGQSKWSLVPAQEPDQELTSALFRHVFNFTYLFLMKLLILFIVVICTVVTVIKLKQAFAWRLATSKSSVLDFQTQQIVLTKMLVVVCCIYVICSTPNCISALVRRIEPHYHLAGRYANMLLLTLGIGSRVFSVANSSVSFFVYYWMSSRFRKELRRLCHGRKATL